MGQKVFKNNSIMTLEGVYPTLDAYKSCLSGPTLRESTNMHHHTFNASCGESPWCSTRDGIGQSICEFQDYCNHLYYINDRCDCASAWKKTTGLVMPKST
jgi:hypothetical protein